MKANELSSKDLMIGDWLQDSFGNIGQVYRLDPGRVHLRLLQERPQDEEYIVHDIEPIPLTPEILEKNGLANDYYGSYFKEDEHMLLEISTSEDCISWTINTHEYGILKLEYVHQLQHALKLCGIDKEIEL